MSLFWEWITCEQLIMNQIMGMRSLYKCKSSHSNQKRLCWTLLTVFYIQENSGPQCDCLLPIGNPWIMAEKPQDISYSQAAWVELLQTSSSCSKLEMNYFLRSLQVWPLHSQQLQPKQWPKSTGTIQELFDHLEVQTLEQIPEQNKRDRCYTWTELNCFKALAV